MEFKTEIKYLLTKKKKNKNGIIQDLNIQNLIETEKENIETLSKLLKVMDCKSFDNEDRQKIKDEMEKTQHKIVKLGSKVCNNIKVIECIKNMEEKIGFRQKVLQKASTILDMKKRFKALGVFFLKKQDTLKDMVNKLKDNLFFKDT